MFKSSHIFESSRIYEPDLECEGQVFMDGEGEISVVKLCDFVKYPDKMKD
jgi:hypothetical protein